MKHEPRIEAAPSPQEQTRAKIVRDAMAHVAHGLTLDRRHDDAHRLHEARKLDDATLAQLGRLLK